MTNGIPTQYPLTQQSRVFGPNNCTLVNPLIYVIIKFLINVWQLPPNLDLDLKAFTNSFSNLFWSVANLITLNAKNFRIQNYMFNVIEKSLCYAKSYSTDILFIGGHKSLLRKQS